MNINEKAMLFVYQREWKNWCSYVVILISHCILKSGVMPENFLSLFLLAGIATIILLPCYHLCFAAYVGCYRYAAYVFFFFLLSLLYHELDMPSFQGYIFLVIWGWFFFWFSVISLWFLVSISPLLSNFHFLPSVCTYGTPCSCLDRLYLCIHVKT